MRSLFDPVVGKIIELIEHQVMTVSQGPHRVNVCEGFPFAPHSTNEPQKSILLVGGFGESGYLYKRVSAWAGRYGVQVIQPREA